jgi:hypothetical protein
VLSPDPIEPARRFPSLSEYLVSLSRIRTLAPTVVRGGHGSDVTDFEAYFTSVVRFTDERQKRLASVLPRGGASAWKASVALFPEATGQNRFLALSETIAHFDFGVAEGRFSMTHNGDAEIYSAVRAS